MYVQAGACEAPCLEALYKMRQSWKALNKDQPRVQRAYFSTLMPSGELTETLANEHPGLRIGHAKHAWFRLLGDQELLSTGMIVIVDPKGLALCTIIPVMMRAASSKI